MAWLRMYVFVDAKRLSGLSESWLPEGKEFHLLPITNLGGISNSIDENWLEIGRQLFVSASVGGDGLTWFNQSHLTARDLWDLYDLHI